ncbi:hypothetical protein, partial [Corynebacterium striatum]|uniref:hypothetical protein n=1 Tax=Corynebacterium striatum TaxID=43770 RepID=UPI001955381E
VPRVLFLGICLDFYYFLWRDLLQKVKSASVVRALARINIFVFVPRRTPAGAGSICLHTATSSYGTPILWTAMLLRCLYAPG